LLQEREAAIEHYQIKKIQTEQEEKRKTLGLETKEHQQVSDYFTSACNSLNITTHYPDK